MSPSQININTPDDSVTGPVLVQVQNANGISNTGTANKTRVSPTMHTAGSFNLNGKQYAIAYTPDFLTFIGQPGMIAGLNFITAKPGDTIVFFALGCGPTNPAIQAGVMAAQNSPLSLPYEVKIGGQTATVTFAGAIAGNVGLYQFNVVVPNVAAGTQTIELTVDGVGNAQDLVITIGQ